MARCTRTVVAALVVSTAVLAAPAARARAAGAMCECGRFADQLAKARALYARRGEGVAMPLTPAARERFKERVLGAYDLASCLVDCPAIAERDRDDARALLAFAAYRSRKLGPTADAGKARLDRALDESTRCLEHTPAPPLCHFVHGAIRGIRAEGSWSPMQLKLPSELLADFRAARDGKPPGSDQPNGAPTRAEATLLMVAPRVAGGDTGAAVRLMEQASRAPEFSCTVDNRLVYAEALNRSGDTPRALAELRTAVAAGLPSCGDDRYENVGDLEQAGRCVARLEQRPEADPGWRNDCK